MRPRRVYTDSLRDILAASEQAQQFVAGMDLAAFWSDAKTQFAVIRALEIIGEAARHIPTAIQQRYPQVPWADMRGMRNVLIHEYFGVDTQVLWRTVQEDIPPLSIEIRKILDEMLGPQSDAE